MANRKLTTEEFIQRANAVHLSKYHYPCEYKGSRSKIQIDCPVHGSFFQTPYSHLAGNGCRHCDQERRRAHNTLQHDIFLRKANIKHNNKYSYPEKYSHSQYPLTIVCPIHGPFTQMPYSHLQGSGCKACADSQRVGGYSRGWFDQFKEKRSCPAMLYLVKLTKDKQSLIKVGISTNFDNRLAIYATAGFEWKVLHQRDLPLYQAWQTEQAILTQFGEYRYYPTTRFDGWTECFRYTHSMFETLVEGIKQILENGNVMLTTDY